MKKRIVAFLLCMVMLACMTPAARAEDSSTPAGGLYATLDNGQLGTPISIDSTLGYKVKYTSGQEKTVYFYYPGSEGYTPAVTCEGANITPVEGMTDVFKITLSVGCCGDRAGSLSFSGPGGYVGWPLIFDDTSYERFYVEGINNLSNSARGFWSNMTFSTDVAKTDILSGDEYNVSCDAGLGTVTWDVTSSSWTWNTFTAIPGTVGCIYLEPKGESGTKYAAVVSISAAYWGLYSTMPNPADLSENYIVPDSNNGFTIDFSGEIGLRTVYLYAGNEEVAFTGEPTTDQNGFVSASVCSENSRILIITLEDTVTSGTYVTQVQFNVTNSSSSDRIWLTFEGGNPGGDNAAGDNEEGGASGSSRPAHSIEEEEKLPEQWENYTINMAGPAEFVYNGTTYYVGRGVEQPDLFGGNFPNWDEEEIMYVHVGFWTKDEQGNFKSVSDELESILLSAFNGTLTVTLYGAKGADGSYPACYPAAGTLAGTDVPMYTFTNQNSGNWVYVLTGTIDGREIVSFSSWEYAFQAVIEKSVNSVAEANEYITNVMENGQQDKNYVIQLPAGTLTGIIKIPENSGLWNITIRGTKDAQSGELKTTLEGGVDANAGFCELKDLILQGAGKSKEAWPADSGEDLAGKPNIGLSGTTIANYFNCIFKDYDVAVTCTSGLRFGGTDTQFIDNRIGIYINTSVKSGGATSMMRFYFSGNGIAIWFVKLHPNYYNELPLSSYQISNTRFEYNDIDIKNDLELKYFAPGNHFKWRDREPVGEADSMVYIYPMYRSYSDGNFFDLDWGEDPTLSNNDTGKYHIPESKLNGKFTVIDQPDTADETYVSFDFGEEETQSISTFSLRRTVEETFDATVVIEKTETTISLTINELPSGKTPTITVPCGDWYDATVTYNGNTVTSTYNSGSVSFVAEQGGTYTIEQIEPEPEIDIPMIPVFTINAANSQNGTVSLSTTHAFYANTVTFTVTPNDGYVVTAVTVTDIWGNQLTVTDNGNNTYSFQMPYCSANVSVTYTVDLPYADISADHENFAAIAYMYENGLMIGTGDGTMFEPEIGLTRAMAATILYRIAGEPPVTYSGKFQDVAAEKWYTDAVEWAVLNGVVYGVGDDRFDPNGQLSHEQILVMLYRLAGSPSIETNLFESQLDKSVVSKWAVDAVCWAIQENILTVEPEIDLTSAILRGEIAELLVSYLNH